MFAPDDTFAGAFGTITDISDQHRAEEARIALAEEKEHIAALKAKDAEEQRLAEVERRRAQGQYLRCGITPKFAADPSRSRTAN